MYLERYTLMAEDRDALRAPASMIMDFRVP